MANEVEIYELDALRGDQAPVAPMPPLAKQVLSIGGAVSAAFNRGANMVRVNSNAACRIEFSPAVGTDPTGAGMTIRIAADRDYDFSAIAGRKVIVVAA